jgi:sigma-B regulation protein RsbU (phosphoserine phosphatase)
MTPDNRGTILVIDDSEVDRLLLGSILSSEGFTVRVARDGATGRRIAREHPPDAIMLDVVMPGEDGFETCRLLKRDPITASIPVIFLSSLEDPQHKVRAFSVGAVDYVAKPPFREEVLARVALHIRLQRAFELRIQEQVERLASVQAAQQSLLTDPRSIPDAKAAVYHRSLHEAGGDFYDILPLGEGLTAYFVADVSGHDVAVSMILSALKALLHQGARLLYRPEECMAAMNAVLCRLLGPEQYVAAAYALLNRRRHSLTVVSAALPPIVRASERGTEEVLERPGDILGKFEAAQFGELLLPVANGDRLFLCTDGCYESLAPRKGPGSAWEMYVAECGRRRAAPLDQAAALVVQSLFPDQSLALDDQLLMVVDV